MKRLVCVVEGRGDVAAIPILCHRVLALIGVQGWHVDADAIRRPRPDLVDESAKSPRRTANRAGIQRALALAAARPANAVLICCDSDDDCPAIWGPSAVAASAPHKPVLAVMIVREYETWLALGGAERPRNAADVRRIERKRDGKRLLAKRVPGYLPTLHQAQLTRSLDVRALWSVSESFDKFIRVIAGLCGAGAPSRPQPPWSTSS